MKARPLNDYTRKELQEAQERAVKEKRSDKACKWCEKKIPMLSWQTYCSDKCRVAFHNFAKQEGQRTLAEALKKENAELLKEIHSLQAEIALLKSQLGVS